MAKKVIDNSIERRRMVVEYCLDEHLTGLEGYKEALRHFKYSAQTVNIQGEAKFNSDETARLFTEERAKRAYTRDSAKKLLDDLKKDCETSSDRTNKLGVIKELNRINRLYDEDNNDISIDQKIVSPAERRKVLMRELELLDQIDNSKLAIAE